MIYQRTPSSSDHVRTQRRPCAHRLLYITSHAHMLCPFNSQYCFNERVSTPQNCGLILIPPCTSIPHLSSRWNWKKTAGRRWACFVIVRVPRPQHWTIQQ